MSPTTASHPAAPVPPEAAGEGRLLSLDVFRGGTIAAMILVNNPGSHAVTYPPLLHAQWHGWTFTDLVFPFFLWMVGVSITFSFAKRVARGDDRGRLLAHILKRSALIYLLGLFLTGLPRFDLSTIRLPGVLARIAVCYVFAGTIFLFTRTLGRALWIVGLLSAYWAVMTLYPVPGYGAGVLEPIGNFHQYVDSLLLQGHMWSQTKVWDPEGIVSTMPSIATTLFGVLAGQIIRWPRPLAERVAWLFLSGNLLVFAGMVMSAWLPINKSLWTSSFSAFMAGMASVVFACVFWLVDGQGWRRFAQPFAVFGVNALAIFVVSGLFAKVMGLLTVGGVSLQRTVYTRVFEPIATPANASLLYALMNVAVCYGVAYLLYRRRWWLKV